MSAADSQGAQVEVAAVLDPASVRRAPRFGRFIGAGVLMGLVIGLVAGGLWLGTGSREVVITVAGVTQRSPILNPGVYFALIVLAATAFGAFIAGVIVVIVDRRSVRSAGSRRQ